MGDKAAQADLASTQTAVTAIQGVVTDVFLEPAQCAALAEVLMGVVRTQT